MCVVARKRRGKLEYNTIRKIGNYLNYLNYLM